MPVKGCPDCDLSEVMSDGTLFCALLEEQVHGDQSCPYWISDPETFGLANREGMTFEDE